MAKASTIKAIRGMHDLLPPQSHLWLAMEEKVRLVFQRFGFEEIRTPMVEATELFSRSIGEATEIISKEMYTFKDRKEKSLSLRPEGTAGVVRAALEGGLFAKSDGPIQKFYYLGPMFRYERPQKGRQRQFYQFGVEVFGDSGPRMDAEVIALGWMLIKEFGLEKNIRLEMNSLGDSTTRPKYLNALTEFFQKFKKDLCMDCHIRLQKNPMRILDCKVGKCIQMAQNAPVMMDFLDSESKNHFEEVATLLNLIDVPFEINPRIVRGLDYYTRTAFEFLTDDLGAKSAVIAGGRYDGLVEELGGPKIPAIGFAAGMERWVMLLEKLGWQKTKPIGSNVFVLGLGSKPSEFSFQFLQKLRQKGISAVSDFRDKSLKAQLRQADRLGTPWVVIIGEDELANKKVVLKNMVKGDQKEVPFQSPEDLLKTLLKQMELG